MQTAYEAESAIVDWIFEKGEVDFLPKNQIKEFIKDRFNRSLSSIGVKEVFETRPVNHMLLETSLVPPKSLVFPLSPFFV